MRILVACEFSGVVRRAFRALGHDAWSCDIIPAEDDSEHHILGSVINHEILTQHWDTLIAFPDCTFLTVSANRWADKAWRMEARHWALGFVKTLWALPIKRKAIENPVGVLPTMWKRPTQIIQPWQFGHPEVKGTCLWLDNLPPLKPTNIFEGREPKVWKEPPGPERKKNRSRTDAELMARGVAPPRIHGEGFSHNNCGGFCVKMGLYQCYLLWKHRLARWLFAEEKEQEFREYIKRTDVSIFRRNNEQVTMRELRALFEGGWIPKKRKQHSCAACMVPTAEEILFQLS
jgi:hypothetical protein